MSQRTTQIIPITWTSNKSQPICVSDFRDITLTIVGTGTAGVLGSAGAVNDVIDFTSSSVIGNAFANVVIADLTAANTYATTLAVTGATKLGEVNTNALTWICITRSADTLDGYVLLGNNQ